MKGISTIHPAITENAENLIVKPVPHILVRESHNAQFEQYCTHFITL